MGVSIRNVWQTLLDILLEPRNAFENIRQHSAWLWLPLFVIILANLGFLLWYYNSVDIGWLRDQIVSARAARLSPEQTHQMGQFLTRGRMIGFSSLAIAIGIPAIYLIHAVYFFLVEKFNGTSELGFASWLNFTIWTHFPGVLAPLATAVAYAFATSKQAFAIDPASLNSLFFHFSPAGRWFQLTATLTLFTLWSVVLMAYGLNRWTGRKLFSTTIIALIPYVVYFGGWATLISARGR